MKTTHPPHTLVLKNHASPSRENALKERCIAPFPNSMYVCMYEKVKVDADTQLSVVVYSPMILTMMNGCLRR